MKDSKPNLSVSYGGLILLAVIGFIPYLGMSAAYGTTNPERWAAKSASLAIMFGVTLLIVGVSFFVIREWGMNLEKIAREIMDVEEMQQKKYLDYVLAHYGNIATVAAFVAVLVFYVKGNLQFFGVTLSFIFLGAMICIVFYLYGFLFLKTVLGAKNRHVMVWLSLMPMFFVDLTLMTMAIKSVPAN